MHAVQPPQEPNPLARLMNIQCSPPTNDLENQHPETVHIRLLGGLACVGHLRCHIPKGASHHCGLLHLPVVYQVGQPKSPRRASKLASNITLLDLMSLRRTHCCHSLCRCANAAVIPAWMLYRTSQLRTFKANVLAEGPHSTSDSCSWLSLKIHLSKLLFGM